MALSFVFAAGGTGGHVFPALAVARILHSAGHKVLFIGRQASIEAKLVAQAGFDMSYIRSAGLNRVGWKAQVRSASLLPGSVASAFAILRKFRPDAVFSTGGFVAGPVMLAARAARIPFVIMEPNATPGFANRRMARGARRILLGFPSAASWSPPARTEVIGVPVRSEFFQLHSQPHDCFTVIVTGGSQGSRTLNRASRESWPLFRNSQSPVAVLHQCGVSEFPALAEEFRSSGVAGEVVPFFDDMPDAFSRADVIVGRAGAGGVSEIAAAGMASILVPLPFAADDHQRRNAEALVNVGAARLVPDREMNGERLYREVEDLRTHPELLSAMRREVRQFARPHAADRASSVLEQVAAERKSWKR